MTSTVRRAVGFALVGTLAFAVPLATRFEDDAFATVVAIGPLLAVAGVALTRSPGDTLFELFARPGDYRNGQLNGLAAFTLAAAGLGIIALHFGLPVGVYVGTVLLVTVGNLGGQLVRAQWDEPVVATAGFVVAAFLGAGSGQVATLSLQTDLASADWAVLAFLAGSGALLAALFREMLFQRDDPLVMTVVVLLLWVFAGLELSGGLTRVGIAIAVAVGLGYLSYALETASLPGMLTGVILVYLTIVLGDFGWFAMLIAFFGIGGLSSKFRYEEKLARGIAQENEGARGTGNVLANSMVALFALLAAAASPELDVPVALFLFAFAGAISAALADTLSSEIGGLYDDPRLITSLAVVEPGTDGAVTWQGQVAGLVGAGTIAAIGFLTVPAIGLAGAGVVVLSGLVGTTVDSLLGATVEGRFVGNQGVNFLATLAAAIAGAGFALALGVVPVP